MTPRERILSLLNGKRPDQVPWFGDLDYWASALIGQGKRPADVQGIRRVHRVAPFARGGVLSAGVLPVSRGPGSRGALMAEGNRRYRELVTPNGNLRECWEYLPESYAEAPIEHLVKSEDDLPALRYVYEHTSLGTGLRLRPSAAGTDRGSGDPPLLSPQEPVHASRRSGGRDLRRDVCEAAAPDEFAETLAVMKSSFDRARGSPLTVRRKC